MGDHVPAHKAATSKPPVDSRQYKYVYPIRSAADVPEDFPAPEAESEMQFGAFLPQDDLRLFGRNCPARMVLLCPGSLVIRAHPDANEIPARIPLEDLQFVESGQILLLGWLRLAAKSLDRTLPYNTCAGRAVEELLARLRKVYAPSVAGLQRPAPAASIFGPPCDLKMENAQSSEMDAGEQILLRFFSPAAVRTQKRRGGKRRILSPADLVLLTNSRIVWITDRHRNRYERYGTVCRYAPLRNICGLSCRPVGDGCEMIVQFGFAQPWRISLPPQARAEAQAFAGAAEDLWRG
jgi:hypothetical protein